MKVSVSCVQKVKEKSEKPTPGIEEVTDNADVLAALDDGSAQVGAGTAWLWSRDEYAGAVLFDLGSIGIEEFLQRIKIRFCDVTRMTRQALI